MALSKAIKGYVRVLTVCRRRLEEEAKNADSVLMLEEAVYAARAIKTLLSEISSSSNEKQALRKFERGISKHLRQKKFSAIADQVHFRWNKSTSLPPRLRLMSGPNPTISNLLRCSLSLFSQRQESPRHAEQLSKLIPAQKIAPIQFAVHRGRLVLSSAGSRSEDADRHNIEGARDALIESGEKILKELDRSNCDKRFIASVKQLQEKLTERQNIIAVGLSSLTCSMMCDAYKEELPLGVSAMIGAHCRSVELYAAQFPDWSRFVENAASAQLETNDVKVVHETTTKLINDLREKAELVDPRVPETLARLNELLRNPATASKRAAFAVLRSIENLASKAFEHCSDFLDKTARGVVDKGSAVTSKVVVYGFLGLAISGAVSITPVASKIHEMQWLSKAIELIQREMRLLE